MLRSNGALGFRTLIHGACPIQPQIAASGRKSVRTEGPAQRRQWRKAIRTAGLPSEGQKAIDHSGNAVRFDLHCRVVSTRLSAFLPELASRSADVAARDPALRTQTGRADRQMIE
jgi:hypothetical protein